MGARAYPTLGDPSNAFVRSAHVFYANAHLSHESGNRDSTSTIPLVAAMLPHHWGQPAFLGRAPQSGGLGPPRGSILASRGEHIGAQYAALCLPLRRSEEQPFAVFYQVNWQFAPRRGWSIMRALCFNMLRILRLPPPPPKRGFGKNLKVGCVGVL